MNRFELTLAGALCVSLAAPVQAQAPSPDDGGVPAFYSWSGKLPARPGQMLRAEPVTDRTPLSNAASSTRILYTSTNGIDGKSRSYVSGELYLPKGTAPKGGWPLMAWAHGTVGIADKCAPSFAGRSQRDINYLNYWLGQGYAVVASDYQGLGTPGRHPYLATRPAAYSVLDSVRAVQKGKYGLSKKVVLIGQSQGGGAAWATAAYARAYAPELDIRGTVATGTPYFSKAAQNAVLAAKPRDAVDPTFAYTLLILTLAEMTDPNFKITDYVSDKAMPTMRVGFSECLGPLERGVTENKLSYNVTFKKDVMDELVKAYAYMGYPTLKPEGPIFMGTGGKDRDVVPPMQESLVKDACAAGAIIEWHFYPDLDHSGTVNGSRQDSTPFVEKAFAGKKIAGNCKS
jgi:acetyl esterase/lipase